MLTTATYTEASEIPIVSQTETDLSDLEVSRRVLEIRAGWSLSERVRRRREAERRFADLLDALAVECEAA
jgi:hypothetical protein